MNRQPPTLKRKVRVGAGVGACVLGSWVGPYFVFAMPVSWLRWFPQNYAFFLHEYLFPFFHTYIPSKPEPGFVTLEPYAIALSVLTWLPLLALFAHFTSRLSRWPLVLSSVAFIHSIAVAIPFLITSIGWHFQLSGP